MFSSLEVWAVTGSLSSRVSNMLSKMVRGDANSLGLCSYLLGQLQRSNFPKGPMCCSLWHVNVSINHFLHFKLPIPDGQPVISTGSLYQERTAAGWRLD